MWSPNDVEKIKVAISNGAIGQEIAIYSTVDSTMPLAHEAAKEHPMPVGLVIVAERQVKGRGRYERRWEAPAGSALLMSVLLGPPYLPRRVEQLPMLVGVAVSRGIKALSPRLTDAVKLKWPNDLVWGDGKKLGGILTESEFEGNKLNWVIVGIGLNVNIDFSADTEPEPDRSGKPGTGHPPLAQTATSLSTIMGQDTTHLRLPILQTFLKNVEQRYTALQRGVSPHFEWQRRLVGIGKTVTVTVLDNSEKYQGKITSVNENGALRLRQDDGSMLTVLAGDVTLR